MIESLIGQTPLLQLRRIVTPDIARRLAQEEGLFVGMSSGAMVWAALEVARKLGPGKRVLTMAVDTGARYLTTALFDGQRDTPGGYKVRSREKVGG